MSALIRNVHSAIVPQPGRSPQTKGASFRVSKNWKTRRCEKVAAICYRLRKDAIEFLLIRTRGSGRWTFPKGSAEPGLTHAQAAAQEAFEEAGVHGRIQEAAFARYSSGTKKKLRTPKKNVPGSCAVGAHLCQVLRLSPPKEANRSRTWFSLDEARQRLRDGRSQAEGDELVRIVNQAAKRIRRLDWENHLANPARTPAWQQGRPDDFRGKDGLQEVHLEARNPAPDFNSSPGQLSPPRILSQRIVSQRLLARESRFYPLPPPTRGLRLLLGSKRVKAPAEA
jgi:8-oxo-dGTP pyrophosphatase MutT (NUDIX family)